MKIREVNYEKASRKDFAKVGDYIEMVKATGVPVMCCGKPMKELTANTVEASMEKHLPDVKVEGNVITAKVGSVEHPMLPEHYIGWVAIETNKGSQRKSLNPGEKPVAEFVLAEGEELVAAYEYCNLHGLWKK